MIHAYTVIGENLMRILGATEGPLRTARVRVNVLDVLDVLDVPTRKG